MQLAGGAAKQICTPYHFGDSLLGVINPGSQLIGKMVVTALYNKVTFELFKIDGLFSLNSIIKMNMLTAAA